MGTTKRLAQFALDLSLKNIPEKFADCASLILSSDKIATVAEMVKSISHLKSVRNLTALIA